MKRKDHSQSGFSLVEVVAEGRESDCRRLLSELESGAAPGRGTRVTHRWGTPRGDLRGFAER